MKHKFYAQFKKFVKTSQYVVKKISVKQLSK